jgi:prepilin-type N-terminal cleavage/methylation domain-containing protein
MMKRKGFTLIELLIVISIIGILASIVLVGLGSFRARGRDARRIADIRSIQNALELYFTKQSTYPAGPAYSNMVTQITGAAIGISNVPNDPLTGRSYVYAPGTCSAGICLNYVVGALLEDSTHEALNNDVDGTVYGVNCADTAGTAVYCVEF